MAKKKNDTLKDCRSGVSISKKNGTVEINIKMTEDSTDKDIKDLNDFVQSVLEMGIENDELFSFF